MHKLVLILISALSLASSSAFAASYQRTDGTIVDPIQSHLLHASHPYAGPNLRPGVSIPNSNLSGASLEHASLSGAEISNANLNEVDLDYADLSSSDLRNSTMRYSGISIANLSGANLSGADLSFSYLRYGDLTGADFSGAILVGTVGLAENVGSPVYTVETVFAGSWANSTGTLIAFDPVAAGWTLVPEPGTALLLGLGLTALAVRRGE
jgi:uncharacterized protein YjbI with pentapeptide repeats